MPNTPIENLSFLYVSNLNIDVTTNTTLTGTSGAARDSTNTFDIVIDETTTINAAVNGANGLDTGSLANSTWYAVHVIGDSTNLKSSAYLLSTSATTPALPYGYDGFRRIGWALTNSSAQFISYSQLGDGLNRWYFWDAAIATAFSAGTTSFVDVALSVGASPTSSQVVLNWRLTPQAAGNQLTWRLNGTSTVNQFVSASVASVLQCGQLTTNCDGSQIIEARTSSVSDTPGLFVQAFNDTL
jgi:hypothetical protein